MMKICQKFLSFVQENREQLFRYFIVGSTAFVLDMTTLFGFKNFLSLNPVVAVMCNQVIMVAYIFTLNKIFSFKSKAPVKGQLLRFILLYVFNYVISVVWMWIFSEKLGYNYLFVRVINIGLSVLWNFILYKNWIYKEPKIEVLTP